MTDPISFNSTTPRFGFPFLFAAQAQKEIFVNEAHLLTDALSHPVVQGTTGTPPPEPTNGECWLVATDATYAFAGHSDELAIHHDSQWVFIAPVEAMSVFNLSIGQRQFYDDGWKVCPTPAAPEGGAVVDIEARAAIAGLIRLVETAGLLPKS